MQPPLRGCVLKLIFAKGLFYRQMQPPLRGCVLKPVIKPSYVELFSAAASARLCVETILFGLCNAKYGAAASARLCVETFKINHLMIIMYAAASARLCVETVKSPSVVKFNPGSRLRAAVC